MRLILLGAGSLLIGAAFMIQACGDTESGAAADAGADVVDSGQKEASADTGAPPCDTSKSVTDDIPDAAIADGASTSGACVQCANLNCSKQLDACNKDCTCQGIAGDALKCFLKNTQDPTACLGPLFSVDPNTRTIGLGLLLCIREGCKTECATQSFQPQDDGGTDSGKTDGGDGG